MSPHGDISVRRDGDLLHVTFERKRPVPVPTRMKFRRRRVLRLMRAATMRAGFPYVGKPVTAENIEAVTAACDAACKAAIARYDHLFF